MWGFLDLSCLAYGPLVLHQCHCTLCGKSNTPRVFQVTWVSYYCVSYPPVYSCTPQSVHERGRETGREEGMLQLVSFRWRSLQGAYGPSMGDQRKTWKWGGQLKWETIPTTDSTSGGNSSSFTTYDGDLLGCFRQCFLSSQRRSKHHMKATVTDQSRYWQRIKSGSLTRERLRTHLKWPMRGQ